jgi:hypothetical protein
MEPHRRRAGATIEAEEDRPIGRVGVVFGVRDIEENGLRVVIPRVAAVAVYPTARLPNFPL